MGEYRIVTESAANLPRSLTEGSGLHILPMHYLLQGTDYAAIGDPNAPTWPEFYARMREGASVQTSMVNAEAYRAAFAACLEAGEDVLYISLSAGVSGCYQSAALAAQELREQYPTGRIELVDSCGAGLGEGLCVLQALRCRQAGGSYDDAVAAARCAVAALNQYFTVDDLEYLKRGGRISSAVAKLGTLLNIKPILWGSEAGTIVMKDKVRGRKRSMARLLEAYDAKCADHGAVAAITHADAPEDAARLRELLVQHGQTGEIIVECFEPVMGAHVGPGALALFFFGHDRAG